MRLAAIGAVAIGLIAFFAFVTTRLSTADMTLLYGDLDLTDSGEIATRLDELDIPYQIRGNGGAIMVPGDEVDRARLLIAQEGLPEQITPFICGFAGYGNVFRGANEIVELLPVEEIEPHEVATVARSADYARDRLYKVVFKEEHTVEPISSELFFELQDYYDHPEKYRPKFSTYLPHLTVLVNCTYWEARYPRLVTKADLKRLYGGEAPPRLQVIGKAVAQGADDTATVWHQRLGQKLAAAGLAVGAGESDHMHMPAGVGIEAAGQFTGQSAKVLDRDQRQRKIRRQFGNPGMLPGGVRFPQYRHSTVFYRLLQVRQAVPAAACASQE